MNYNNVELFKIFASCCSLILLKIFGIFNICVN